MFIKMLIINIIIVFQVLNDNFFYLLENENVANTINGYIYEDFNRNDTFDLFEDGIEGVIIELYSLSGSGPCPNGTLTFLATTTTDSVGKYKFGTLTSGKYIVRVSNLNFNDSGSLNRYSYLSSLEYCIQLNGVFDPGAEEYNFGFFLDCPGNSTWTQWPNCEIASENPVICDLRILDLFCTELMSQNSLGTVPNPLCPGGGESRNMSWFAFMAGTGSYEIVIKPLNCKQGDGGQLGLQAGIYTDCSFTNAVFCQPECKTDSIALQSEMLVPGQIYYFFVNGCEGSSCFYDININGDYSPYDVPWVLGLEVNSDGCNSVCLGKDAHFELQGWDLEIDYTWSVVDQNGTEPDLNFPSGWPKTTKNNVTLNFTEPGVYTVCMDEANNKCHYRGPVCMDVEVKPFKEIHLVQDDHQVLSGDTLNIQVALQNDSISNLIFIPIQNNSIQGMKSDTLLSGSGVKKDVLYNLTNKDQTAQYLVYVDSLSNCCVIPDTLKVTVLPGIPIYSKEFLVCKDTCLSIYASIPDTTVSWIQYLWNTSDTTSMVNICPEMDTVLYVFVQDTNKFTYKIEYPIRILDFEDDVVLNFESDNQISCSDSMITLSYHAEFSEPIGDNLIYIIYDCSGSGNSPVFFSTAAGFITFRLNNLFDSVCYVLEVRYENCIKEKKLIFANPNYLIGKPCDDNNPLTINDVYDEFCICQGEIQNNTSDNNLLKHFTVFPNPASESFQIVNNRTDKVFDVELWSTFGQLIQTHTNTNNSILTIDVSRINPGLYILKVLYSDIDYYYKIIII